MTTISKMAHFCFQEDISEYLVNKVVSKLLNSKPKLMERYFLANYIRLQLAETFLAPGESVVMKENADSYHVIFFKKIHPQIILRQIFLIFSKLQFNVFILN